MLQYIFILQLLLLTTVGCASDTSWIRTSQRTDVQKFIKDMVKKHQFEASELEALFDQVEIKSDVLRLIQRQAEAKPWYAYRLITVSQKNVINGRQFYKDHYDELKQAEAKFGVPASIITAILGVESKYGRIKGGFRVIDALSTLAFNYPRRAKYFSRELEQFLLFTREDQFNPLEIKGSFAGAMGAPQFMPSSYRRYAVDATGSGQRDLISNTSDAIASIANYLKTHGWKKDQPIATNVYSMGNKHQKILDKTYKPHLTPESLKQHGIVPSNQAETIKQTSTLLSLDHSDDEKEYWLGFKNFHVITRYNNSKLYAMAIYQLAREIEAEQPTLVAQKTN